LFRQSGAKKTERSHLRRHFAVEAFFAIGRENAGKELVLRVGAGGVARHPLILGKLAFEIEWVLPVEGDLVDARSFGFPLFGFGALLGDRCHNRTFSNPISLAHYSRSGAPVSASPSAGLVLRGTGFSSI